MRRGTRLLDAFRNGDHLTDAELIKLRNDMDTIAGILTDYGDVFKLARDYARKIEIDCAGFIRSRARGTT